MYIYIYIVKLTFFVVSSCQEGFCSWGGGGWDVSDCRSGACFVRPWAAGSSKPERFVPDRLPEGSCFRGEEKVASHQYIASYSSFKTFHELLSTLEYIVLQCLLLPAGARRQSWTWWSRFVRRWLPKPCSSATIRLLSHYGVVAVKDLSWLADLADARRWPVVAKHPTPSLFQ